jgi:uncharacterized protein YneF (UPF0154 family)
VYFHDTLFSSSLPSLSTAFINNPSIFEHPVKFALSDQKLDSYVFDYKVTLDNHTIMKILVFATSFMMLDNINNDNVTQLLIILSIVAKNMFLSIFVVISCKVIKRRLVKNPSLCWNFCGLAIRNMINNSGIQSKCRDLQFTNYSN